MFEARKRWVVYKRVSLYKETPSRRQDEKATSETSGKIIREVWTIFEDEARKLQKDESYDVAQ